jgi:hypothetical protein
MTKKILWAVPLMMLLGSALYAQDIVGEMARNGRRPRVQDCGANRKVRQRELERQVL